MIKSKVWKGIYGQLGFEMVDVIRSKLELKENVK